MTVSGVTGSPPPPTTKLAVCALGGYQCEISMYAVGLDIEGKQEELQKQIIDQIPNAKDYSVLRVDRYGVAAINPRTQADASVRFRVFCQAERKETLSTLGPTIMAHALGGFVGLHGNIGTQSVYSHVVSDAEIQVGTGHICGIYSVYHTIKRIGFESYLPWR